MAKATCSIDGCAAPVEAREWCQKHYTRWYRHGDPVFVLRIQGDDEARFWSHVDKDGPLPGADTLAAGKGACWLWTGAPDSGGYGTMRFDNSEDRPHRFSYQLHIGPLIAGMHIDHLCRARLCVNPDHLEQIPPEVNWLRGRSGPALNALKAHCDNGHEFTPENTIRNRATGRRCRACNREWQRERRVARREATA